MTTENSKFMRISSQMKKILFVLLIFLLESTVFALGSQGKFVSGVNILNASVQVSVIVLIAIGQMCVIITAGIDLSIGANIGFSGQMAAMAVMTWRLPAPLGVLIGIGSATFIGMFNGLIAVYLKITPFIVTFVMQCIVRGTIYLLLGDQSSIYGLPESYKFLGTGRLFGLLPMPVFLVAVLAAVFTFIITKTRTGRYLYAVGSNEDSARLSGINIRRVLIKTYVISGFLAGVTGILTSARLGSATAQAGMNAELDAVAAAVIGGTSLLGGVGLPVATIIGACIIGVLQNGMTLMGVSGNWQLVTKGVVVLTAAALDIIKKEKEQ